MYYRVICVLLFLLSSISCEAQTARSKTAVKNGRAISVCMIAKNFENELELVKTHAKEILITEEEECLFSLMDSLKICSILKGNQKYLVVLDSLAKYSDGYVSEYFAELIPDIFYENFDLLIDYLLRNERSEIKQYLIDGLSLEAGMSKDRAKEQNKIEAFVKVKMEKRKFSEAQKKTIKMLLESIDPERWD